MKTLQGVRIAVTRAATQSQELAAPLAAAGADVLLCPLIKIEPREIDTDMRRALDRAATFDWIVFTSANGVERLLQLVPLQELNAARIACVGPATARVLEGYGRAPDVLPSAYLGEAIASALAATDDLRGKNVLIARASGGGQGLPAALRRAGANVYDLELYQSVEDAEGAQVLRTAYAAGKIDLVTFTSGSTVSYFVQTVGIVTDILVAVIGPSTAEVARHHGLRVDIKADPHSVDGLVAAIIDYYAAARGESEASHVRK